MVLKRAAAHYAVYGNQRPIFPITALCLNRAVIARSAWHGVSLGRHRTAIAIRLRSVPYAVGIRCRLDRRAFPFAGNCTWQDRYAGRHSMYRRAAHFQSALSASATGGLDKSHLHCQPARNRTARLVATSDVLDVFRFPWLIRNKPVCD